MKKALVVLALAVAGGMAVPRPAAADFGISIGGPGFGLWLGLPFPPVHVAPAPVYVPPPPGYYPPVHYALRPYIGHRHYRGCEHWGWRGRGRGHHHRYHEY